MLSSFDIDVLATALLAALGLAVAALGVVRRGARR